MELVAQKRTILGKKVKSLRKKGVIPGVVFGKNKKSTPIQLKIGDLKKVLKHTSESTLLDLKIAGNKNVKVLISEIQQHPVNNALLHINFHEINLREKTSAQVPIELVGESPAVKSGKGILIQLMDEIEVECLPTDLPKAIKVDISSLKDINDSVCIKDLKIDRNKIEINHNENDLIAKIDHPKQEEKQEQEEEAETTPEETNNKSDVQE